MAGRGPAPTGKAIRRNKPEKAQLLVSDGKLRGFPLPDASLVFGEEEAMAGEDWHPMTVKWWEAWRRSPQAAHMLSEPDWYSLLDTALIHHKMWSNGKWEFASEVRLRVAKFGATPEDRQRLRIEIDNPEEYPVGMRGGTGNAVSDISERRKRLSS